MKQRNVKSSEKENKNNKKIFYKDYIILKDSYKDLGEKYKKSKEDNELLNKKLQEYQIQMQEFQQTKNNIYNMVQQIKEIIQNKKINNNNEEENKKIILELKNEINKKNEENSEIKEIYQKLEAKIKILENEILLKNEEIKKKDEIIENMSIMEKAYNEKIKTKEEENDLIKNEINKLKEEFEIEKEKLITEIKSKDTINFELKERNINLENQISKLEHQVSQSKDEDRYRNKFINTLSICPDIYINFEGEEKEIALTPQKEKRNYNLIEEKNTFITISKISETNLSTNKNDILIRNSDNTYNKMINDNIINNYLNTINVGYNGLNEKTNNTILDNEDEGIIQSNLEIEPIPSFILCLKKGNNFSNN